MHLSILPIEFDVIDPIDLVAGGLATRARDGDALISNKPGRLEEATKWFAAQRAGAMVADQRQAFDEWRADARNQAALEAVHEMWGELAVLKYVEPRIPTRRVIPGFALAAGALLVGCVVLGGVWVLAAPGSRIETAVGEQHAQSLPDGSLIAVNVASNLRLGFAGGQRRVEVREGEAAFTVKPDAAHPFVVVAGDYRIEAKGTSFNVRRRGDVVEVAVKEGRVEVCRAVGAREGSLLASLGPGQLLRIPASQASLGSALHAEDVPAADIAEWRLRVVSYEDASLSEVVADLNRYFPRKLEISRPELLARRVTIRLQVEDREKAIATLASLLGLKVREAPTGDTHLD